ncbi:YceI family protein [Streptomyces alanosinicus]|uniref:Polyisoprenoid-binding protein n=1 Tax=Streptomyces alanosinicus TaxID=68171 RepID=A0A918YUH0_9ACTN|nr:YceI family protein [Streptomyces alanosinicus]GHE14395.1 polyisoprenoid-binding protein [Streptomyces alanosinicus]
MSPLTALAELTGDYVFDLARTRIGFVARHAMGTRVRGHFAEFEGGAHLDGSDPSKSSVRLTIPANGIRTGSRRRDDQLCDVFLGVHDHPSLRFVSTGVQQRSASMFAVGGDLTVRGVTRPVTLALELSGVENDLLRGFRVRFTGGTTTDRNDWGVNWNAATRLMVSPKVFLELDVTTIRNA